MRHDTWRGLTLFVATLLPAGVAGAQASSSAPAGYDEAMIKAGGQLDALAVYCGKADMATVEQHKAKLRDRFSAKGVATATFDRGYDAAFNDTLAKAKADPTRGKQACTRMKQIGTAVKEGG